MKFFKMTLLIFGTILFFTNCWSNLEQTFHENNSNFEVHRNLLNSIIQEIETNYLSHWDGNTIVLIVDSLSGKLIKVVQLIFAPCDENTVKNHHYYDGYHRDFWSR